MTSSQWRLLAVADTLLLQGAQRDPGRHRDPDEVLVVDPPELVRRAIPLAAGARRAIAVVAAMVVLLATRAVPPAVAGLLAAGALIVHGVLSIDKAYRGVSWTTAILVAGMIPLSTAMIDSGAAGKLADRLVAVVGTAGPYARCSPGCSCSPSCSASYWKLGLPMAARFAAVAILLVPGFWSP